MRAQPTASHFIDGAYVEDDNGASFESLYPATLESAVTSGQSAAAATIHHLAHR